MKPYALQSPGAGFTLVELLVVVLLLAILVTAAVPGWRQQQWRAGRIEGAEALLDLALAQERHFARVRRYASRLDAAPPDGLGLPVLTAQGRYRLELRSSVDGLSFEAVATAVGAQSGDTPCATISIDEAGRRRPGTAECWAR